MRILLAIDGSVSSDRAVTLLAGLPLPAGTHVRVVAVQQPLADLLAMTWASASATGIDAVTEEEAEADVLREAIHRAEDLLQERGLEVDGFLVRGRPGSAIVDEAVTDGSDLVVLGSRGHGTIATMLLGSTAAEVVDHAPCPVLVARSETLGPVVLADDGSSSARTAETLLAAWPCFRDVELRVASVAELAMPVAAGFTPGLYDQVLESYSASVDDVRREVATLARTTAGRLADAGLRATDIVLEGDPASELVRYAGTAGIGTIVVGTRGHTGLARLVLGSVARNVLVHAPCSVLVARERR